MCSLLKKTRNMAVGTRLRESPIWPIFEYVNLHYQQNIYTPYIKLTKFEPLKPSRFGDIRVLVFKISKEAVKQPCLDQKIQIQKYKQIQYSQNTHTSCVYFYPIYPNVVLKKLPKGGYVPSIQVYKFNMCFLRIVTGATIYLY